MNNQFLIRNKSTYHLRSYKRTKLYPKHYMVMASLGFSWLQMTGVILLINLLAVRTPFSIMLFGI